MELLGTSHWTLWLPSDSTLSSLSPFIMGWARESVKTPEVTESPRKRIHKTQFFCASTTTTVTSLNLKAISQLKESGKEAHLRVKKTRKCYAGHVKRGQEWLAKHFHATMDPNELSAPEVTATEEDLYEDPIFPAMFDCIPNKTSNKALALFLTYKGFHQNLSQETVEGIHAAFKILWDSVWVLASIASHHNKSDFCV